jgi:hypothetical protein
MGILLRLIDLFLIAYFTAALGLFAFFTGLENLADITAEVLRPFVSVFIPIYNIGYTIIALISLSVILILTAVKHLNTDEVEKIKPIKRLAITKILLHIKSCALIWLAWGYGAHYMAFMVFVRVILSRLYTKAANSAIEQLKDRAVQIIGEGKE